MSPRRRRKSWKCLRRESALYGHRAIGTGTVVGTCGLRAAGCPKCAAITGRPITGNPTTVAGALRAAIGSTDRRGQSGGGRRLARHLKSLRSLSAVAVVERQHDDVVLIVGDH